MTEPTRAVIRNQTVINVIILDDPTATLWRTNNTIPAIYGTGAELIDLTGVTPAPSVGWAYDGFRFVAPTGATSGGTPHEEETMTGVVKTVDPLTVTLPGYGDQPAQRHGGYTPMAGDKVQVTYSGGHWIIADKVM